MDLAILLDGSSSVGTYQWLVLLERVILLLSHMAIGPEDVQVAVVTFGDDAIINFCLDQYSDQEELFAAIRLIHYMEGRSNLGKAMMLAMQVFESTCGDRVDAPNALLMFLDGEDNMGYGDISGMRHRLIMQYTAIIAVGVGKDISMETIQELAYPENAYATFDKFADIDMGLIINMLFAISPICNSK